MLYLSSYKKSTDATLLKALVQKLLRLMNVE
jgi:hypothetical protein